jgi:hypothetical protein
MRILNFTANDEEKYNLIYEGFVMSGRPMKGPDLRVCAKVFDKLETIGKYSENEKDKNRGIHVLGKPGKVALEEVEYNLLKSALDEVAWNTLGARKAAPIMDWLVNIPEETTVKESLKVER